MAYDPYNEVISLLSEVRANAPGAREAIGALKNNSSFYRSTYSEAASRMKKTADDAASGRAYKDETAQAIRDQYSDYAHSSSAHALADGASDTSGNVSTYAAAQANRAAQDMLAAGEKAVADSAKERMDARIAADKNLLSAAQTVFDALGKSGSDMAELSRASDRDKIDVLDALLGMIAKSK